jgi:hypothetical protein
VEIYVSIEGMVQTRFRSAPVVKKDVPDLFSNLWRTQWRMKFARVDAFCAHTRGESDRSKFTISVQNQRVSAALYFLQIGTG